MKEDQEFWAAFIIYLSVISIGLMVSFVVGILVIGVRKNLKKKQLIKELYGDKERKNGQHKSGARGKW